MIDNDKAAVNRTAREERKRAHLRGMMDRYVEQFRGAGSQDPLSVAREAHAAIAIVLERDLKRDPASSGIRCGKGCSRCCHGAVDIWPQEAALLVEAARAAGLEIDRERLERQDRHSTDTWWEQQAAERACVFLGEDGACKVYESRPNACRKLLVTTDPQLCDQQDHPGDGVERWFSWEAEILDSAAQETFGAGLMPGMLLAALMRRP